MSLKESTASDKIFPKQYFDRTSDQRNSLEGSNHCTMTIEDSNTMHFSSREGYPQITIDSNSKVNGSSHVLTCGNISCFDSDNKDSVGDDELEIYDEMFAVDEMMIDESSYDEENPSGDNGNAEPTELFQVLFILISFGYMLPWTSLGSLISYYKANYSASFYVKLYCAFYLPGLPVALFQYYFDMILDSYYGSQVMYLLRGLISYIIMMGILVSLVFFDSELFLILVFGCLGEIPSISAIHILQQSMENLIFIFRYSSLIFIIF